MQRTGAPRCPGAGRRLARADLRTDARPRDSSWGLSSAGRRSVQAPEHVRLRFNEPVDAAFDPLKVYDAQGKRGRA